MDGTKIFWLILGMAVVTYIPRALPIFLSGKMKFSGKFETFLKLIPYTAMTALIFPGILTVDAARPEIGIVGGLAVVLLAWKKAPLLVCVLGAIGADMLLYLFL